MKGRFKWMKRVTEGSVWFYTDANHVNKGVDKPNERTICYDRPCIILSIQNNVATIIPLTSKQSKFYVMYPIQIQEGLISHAILSQVKTVDMKCLKYFIGILKKDIFEDVKTAFYALIDNKKVVRTVAQRFNKLDIQRFYQFHIYEVDLKDRTDLFMVLQDRMYNFYEIPIYTHQENTLIDGIKTLCGFLDMSKIKPLRNKRYYQTITDIGIEYRSYNRDQIVMVGEELLGVKFRDLRYRDPMEDLSKAIYHHFGSLAYRQGMIMIDELCNNPDAQDLIFNKPWKILNLKQKPDLDSNLAYIRRYILNHLNPLMCSLLCLEILDMTNKRLLNQLIEPHIGIFNLAPTKRTSKIFDGTKVHGKYNISCMGWIYGYIIHNQLSDNTKQ
jgi:hypothetical protein